MEDLTVDVNRKPIVLKGTRTPSKVQEALLPPTGLTYPSSQVLVGPVCGVRLGVHFQDVVKVGEVRGRLNVAVQNTRSPDFLTVEPANDTFC